MKKVYCTIFDYQGYNERMLGIYEHENDAVKRLVTEAQELGYDNVADYMEENELSLAEWECNLNNRRLIQPNMIDNTNH